MSQPAKANAANPKLAENLAKADKYLARFRGKRLPHFIAGAQDLGRSGQSFENLTPVDNSSSAKLPAAMPPISTRPPKRLNVHSQPGAICPARKESASCTGWPI